MSNGYEQNQEKRLALYQKKATTIKDFLYRGPVMKQLEAALPKFLTPEKFMRTFYSAMLRNEKLLDCRKETMLTAMIEMAMLGLEPILGKAALIPYGTECQFQPMWRGLIDLARRSSQITISAQVVFSGDDFDYQYGLTEDLHHKPAEGDRGDMRGAYTVWAYPERGVPREFWVKTFLYMSRSEIEAIRDKSSKAWQNALAYPNNPKAQDIPWINWPEWMWKKTVIKQHSKLEPCSIEMERARELDDLAEIGGSQHEAFRGFHDDIFPNLRALAGEEAEKEEADEYLAEFERRVKEEKLDRAKIDKFLEYVLESHGVQEGYTKEDMPRKALETWDKFVLTFKSWSAKQEGGNGGGDDETGLKGEIGRMKTTGLIGWEKVEHEDLLKALAGDHSKFSKEDIEFFLEKWKAVIKHDYTEKGQPGFREVQEEPPGAGGAGEGGPGPESGGEEEPPPLGDDDFGGSGKGSSGKLLGGTGTDPGDEAGRAKIRFQGKMLEYQEALRLPTFNMVLRARCNFKDIGDVPPEKYEEVIRAMEMAVDEENAKG